MLSKNRSVLLLIVLAVVVVIYLLLTFTRDDEKNFRTQLDDFDTATVNRIEIYVDEPPEDVFLVKKSGNWMVELPTMLLAADDQRVESVFTQLDGTRILNIAANDPSKWKEFNTANEKGTRVRIMGDDKVLADLIVGKFDFIQPKTTQQQNPYMRQPQGEMRSYVRIFGENEVYTIDGMISFGIGKTVDDYVDKSLTSFNFDDISQLDFEFADGNSFQLLNADGKWMINDQKADSAATISYLKKIGNLRGKEVMKTRFEDKDPFATVTIGKLEGGEIKIESFALDSASYALHSSINPQNILIDSDGSVVEKVFVSKNYFLGKEE